MTLMEEIIERRTRILQDTGMSEAEARKAAEETVAKQPYSMAYPLQKDGKLAK